VSDPLVRANNLDKQYRTGDSIVRAISGVCLTIEPGEFVGVVGRSGSGKSTLMSLLGLLERPDSGGYMLKGQDVASLDEDARAALRRREIGFVFQMSSLLARSSASENVELPLIYAGIERAARQRRAKAALDRVGLSHRIDHWPHQLSGGEQQRVAIARALVNDPALILADEPTGALDSKTADEILSLFEELNGDGRTIVVVTHASDVARRVRRRITLHDGSIISDARVDRCNGHGPESLQALAHELP
jgi:putative ABC transport system ATP-binding protein